MFYYNFVNLCNKAGLAPSAAAENMGYQRSVVTRWSKGTEPRQATLQKVADYFGVTVEDLLADNEKKPTPQTESELSRKFATLTVEEAQDAMRYINFLISQRGK